MKDLSIDFGLLIAYLIPGTITLRALSYLPPRPLDSLFAPPLADSATGVLLIISLSLLLGMVVSILRATLIDRSFAISMQKLRFAPNRTPYGAVKRVEPQYEQFRDEGILNAFREAVSQEKRPYQFYGNSLLASFLLVICWVYSHYDQASNIGFMKVIWAVLLLVGWGSLYVGARISHSRYMAAVESLNAVRLEERSELLQQR